MAVTILFFWVGPLDVFNYPKSVVLTTGMIALLLTSVLTRFHLIRQNLSKSSELFVLGSITTIVLGAATHDLLSFMTLWGQFGRSNGILPRVCLYLLILMYLWFGNSHSFIRFLRMASFVLVVEVIYGFMQATGSDIFDWNNPYGNIFVTTGNPNFASSLVALLTLLNLVHVYYANRRETKISLSILSLLGAITVYETKSIQGLVVLAIAMIACFFLFTLKAEIRGAVKTGIAALLAVLSTTVLLGLLNIGPLKSLLFQETLNVRYQYWTVALKIIREHPWKGVGIDSYGDYFRLYRDPSFVEKYGVDLISNNAHNVALQWGAEIGILGLLLYVGLLIIPSWIYFKQGGLNPKKKIASTDFIYIVYVCFYLQSLISITQLSVTVLGFAVLGNLLMLMRREREMSVENEMSHRKVPTLSTSKANFIGVGTWWLLIAVLLSIFTVSPVKYDMRLANAMNLPGSSQGTPNLSIRSEAIKKSIDPFMKDSDYLNFAIQNLFREGDANVGVEIARMASQENPNSWVAFQSLVLAYSQFGKSKEAVQSGLKALELDPLNYKIMVNIAMQAQRAGQIDVAKEFTKRALASAPIESEAFKNAKILESTLSP